MSPSPLLRFPTYGLVCTLTFLFATVDAKGTRHLNILASDVSIRGRLEVRGKSAIHGIGAGIVQVRDKEAKSTVLVGTSKAAGMGKIMRMMAPEGQGIGVSSSRDAGGFFVDAATGFVGVNTTEAKFALHVEGALRCQNIIAGHEGPGSALLLSEGSLVVGQPNKNGGQMHAIGRGTPSGRTMSVQIPSVSEYGNSGKPPQVVYQSTSKTLATISADAGNAFISGTVSVGLQRKKQKTDSSVHVQGSVRMSSGQLDSVGEVTVFFPYAEGSNPSFSIRANAPEEAKAIDTKLFITSGKSGESRVGVNTLKPKAKLHVEGHLHLSHEDTTKGDATLYFPASGDRAGFFLRSADKPQENDHQNTRLFVSSLGGLGVNTVKATSGLEIHARGGLETGQDILIKHGNLWVQSGVRDVDEKHFIELDGHNHVHALSAQHRVSVGTDQIQNSTANGIHLQGNDFPTLRVENPGTGPAAIALQTEKAAWNIQTTSKTEGLLFTQMNDQTKTAFFMAGSGQVVVGTAKNPEPSALHLEHTAGMRAPENSLAISKGSLTLHGAVSKHGQAGNKAVVWSLQPSETSYLNAVNVEGKIAIGLKQHEEALSMGNHHAASLGKTAFLYSSGHTGSISYNEYSVHTKQTEHKLHYPNDFGAALRVSNDGTVHFEGTSRPGEANMNSLFVVDPSTSSLNFGRFAQFGFRTSEHHKIPLMAIGNSEEGSTLAFGGEAKARGHLGSDDNLVFLSTADNQKFVSLNHHSGNVGIGTQNATEELSILSSHPKQTTVLLTTQGMQSTITMSTSGSLELAASGGMKEGKLSVEEFTSIEFASTNQSGGTVFDRTDALGEEASQTSGTNFISGKVGMGVENPQKQLHVNGDTWWQGKMVITKGFARDDLEEESLLQVGESEAQDEEQNPNQGDVVTMLEQMAKLARANKARLSTQQASIARLENEIRLLIPSN